MSKTLIFKRIFLACLSVMAAGTLAQRPAAAFNINLPIGSFRIPDQILRGGPFGGGGGGGSYHPSKPHDSSGDQSSKDGSHGDSNSKAATGGSNPSAGSNSGTATAAAGAAAAQSGEVQSANAAFEPDLTPER
jgi:hypothetical protein